MITLEKTGAYLVGGTTLIPDDADAKAKGSTTRAGSGDISERRKLSAARTH